MFSTLSLISLNIFYEQLHVQREPSTIQRQGTAHSVKSVSTRRSTTPTIQSQKQNDGNARNVSTRKQRSILVLQTKLNVEV